MQVDNFRGVGISEGAEEEAAGGGAETLGTAHGRWVATGARLWGRARALGTTLCTWILPDSQRDRRLPMRMGLRERSRIRTSARCF